MDLILHRICHRQETIDGQIRIDGLKVCDCAENAHHCLPPGNYPIIIAHSHKHARKMPCIITDQSSRIPYHESRIESGNGVYKRTDGSIIVGKHLIPGILTHSRPAFDALYDRIRKNIERGNSVTLIISNV